MFGPRYYGPRYFGPRYWGNGSDTPPAVTEFPRRRHMAAVLRYSGQLALAGLLAGCADPLGLSMSEADRRIVEAQCVEQVYVITHPHAPTLTFAVGRC